MGAQNALSDLVEVSGGQAAFARSIDAAPALVHQWIRGYRPVSPRFAVVIEQKHGLSKQIVRPDIFGDPPAPATVITPKPEPPKSGGKARVVEREAA